jgi:hypothetical protein
VTVTAGKFESFRCGFAAAWLPRVAGGALLAAAVLVVLGVDPDGSAPYSGMIKAVVLTAAAGGALFFVRRGSEVRLVIGVGPAALRVSARRVRLDLPWEEIEAIDYDPPFGTSVGWLPALVLVDAKGRRFRIPAVIDDGPALLATVLEKSPRPELRTWAEARSLATRLGRARWFVGAGYLAAGAILVAAVLYAYR